MADYADRHKNVRLFVVDSPCFLAGPGVVINPHSLFSRHPFGGLNPYVPRCHVLVPHPPAFGPPTGFPSVMVRVEEESTIALRQFMINEGLFPPLEEEEKRRDVIEKIKQILVKWVKKVAWQRRLPEEQIRATNATIITYGSYGLGVYGSESDLDALCVGPYFATIAEDFFVVLQNMLKSRAEVTEINCVKDAKVPLMRFIFDGISVDLPYAQLQLLTVPDNLDFLNLSFLRHIDEVSWRSLSGARTNKRILELVPDLEIFQSLLRSLKLWAKRRGVYGNPNGFLGGIHLAILAGFVCQNYPNESLSALVAIFFSTFAFWQWPMTVGLNDRTSPQPAIPSEGRGFMPICLPCGRNEYWKSNITWSTYHKIMTEFLRGHSLTRNYFRHDFNWRNLFETFPYAEKYARFVKVHLSASCQEELVDWVGWVKSRFRCLLMKVYGLCDPNPTEYIDRDSKRPNLVLYWGLQSWEAGEPDIESMEVEFLKNINNGYQNQGSGGKLQLSVVQASQLPWSFLKIRKNKHQG